MADGKKLDVSSRRDDHKKKEVTSRLLALDDMDSATLRREWRRRFRSDAPTRVRRDLLLLGVAWKIQEQAYGGFSPATKRRLNDLAANLERDGDVRHARATRLKPGAKLVREWQGRTHTVTVTEDGFHWNGKAWRSLSKIASEITGGHWSGPRFFGLNRTRAQPGPNEDQETANG